MRQIGSEKLFSIAPIDFLPARWYNEGVYEGDFISMYIKYISLSDSVIKDEKGKSSIIGIFSVIYAEGFPCSHSSLSLFMRLEGGASEIGPHKFQINFVDADHNPVVPTPLEGDFHLNKQTVPFEGIPLAQELTININGLPIPREGLYEFLVSVDGRYLGSSTLYAIQRQP